MCALANDTILCRANLVTLVLLDHLADQVKQVHLEKMVEQAQLGHQVYRYDVFSCYMIVLLCK